MDKIKLLWSKTNRWHKDSSGSLKAPDLRVVGSGLKPRWALTSSSLPKDVHRWTSPGYLSGGSVLLASALLCVIYFITTQNSQAFFILAVVESRIIPGGQMGFQCNDPALSHTFNGDTISFKLLMATIVLLPLAVMLLVERIYHNDKTVKHKQAICWYKEYLFGVMMNLLIVQVLKLIVGSPRPHFFDTCSPKEALTWQGTEYVSSYTCTKAYWLNQSDKSFPSGHTSLAVHTALFLAYYLHRRTSCPGTSKIIILQVLCVAAAVICGVSRMTDHRHHWWDVLAGVVIAAPILLWTINSLCGNFECANKTSTTDDPTSIDTGVANVPLINKET